MYALYAKPHASLCRRPAERRDTPGETVVHRARQDEAARHHRNKTTTQKPSTDTNDDDGEHEHEQHAAEHYDENATTATAAAANRGRQLANTKHDESAEQHGEGRVHNVTEEREHV